MQKQTKLAQVDTSLYLHLQNKAKLDNLALLWCGWFVNVQWTLSTSIACLAFAHFDENNSNLTGTWFILN